MSPNIRCRHVLSALSLIVVATVAAGAPNARQDLHRVLLQFELQPMAEAPVWAKPAAPPRFSFVWISDVHLTRRSLARTRAAFRYVDQTLRPAFVIFTGDNNAYAPGGSELRGPDRDTRRQQFFKDFLRQNLRTPHLVLPGDNWPWAFDKVFGAFQFSFDYGGVHFLCTSLDRVAPGSEQSAVFDESTWAWMIRDLVAARQRPTLVLMHESIVPPAFIDAPRLRELLEATPNVIGTMCGHLHADLQFRSGKVTHLVAPALGPHPGHGLKLLTVYRHAIVVTTHEYDAAADTYVPARKWQRLDIPLALRPALDAPVPAPFTPLNYREIPAHPRRRDPGLRGRDGELTAPLLRFMLEQRQQGWAGLNRLAPPPASD